MTKLKFFQKKPLTLLFENPWDGAILITDKSCLSLFKFRVKYLFVGVVLFIWAVLFFSVYAQSTLPPNVDLEKQQNTTVVTLNRNVLETAEDYQDFLKQLKKIAQDYHRYFAQLNNSEVKTYQSELSQMIKNIDRGNYYININQLSDNLNKLNKDLEITINQSSNNTTFEQLAKSLHLELSLLDRIFNVEITPQLQKNKRNLILIQSYLLQEKIKNYKTAIEKKQIKLNEIKLSETLKKLKLLQTHLQNQTKFLLSQKDLSANQLLHLTDSLNQVNISRIPEIDSLIPPFNISRIPEIDSLIPPFPPANNSYTNSSGKTEMVKVIIDSIKIPSRNQLIKIKNQTGTLKITGWNKNKLTVVYQVKIQTENNQTDKVFFNKIKLELTSKDKIVTLNSDIPPINDPKRKIISSSMDIKVPQNREIECNNSFGKIDITNSNRSIKVKANYCDINIDNSKGSIAIQNKMGSTRIKNSSDFIVIQSSYGPVVIANSQADINIENSFAPVKISSCEGELNIKNSGQISVENHNGPLNIDNTYGVVEVKKHTGKMEIKNSFQPLFISHINGSVKVENAYALISANDINGSLTAINKFGPISGTYINGSLHLTNQNGNINLILNEPLQGASSINANFSTIDLKLSPDVNTLLTATSTGGTIQSSFAAPIKKQNLTSSTKLKIGSGKTPFDITGNYATIIIDQNK